MVHGMVPQTRPYGFCEEAGESVVYAGMQQGGPDVDAAKPPQGRVCGLAGLAGVISAGCRRFCPLAGGGGPGKWAGGKPANPQTRKNLPLQPRFLAHACLNAHSGISAPAS